MKKQMHVAASPLSGTIFCGKVDPRGNTWGSDKADVTLPALVAVAEHATWFKGRTGEDVIISKPDGTPEYRISVEKL